MRKRQLIYETFSQPSNYSTYLADDNRVYSTFSVDGFEYIIDVLFIEVEDDSNRLGLTYDVLVDLRSVGRKYKLTKNNHPFKLASNIIWLLDYLMGRYSVIKTYQNLKSFICIKSIIYKPLFIWDKEFLKAIKFMFKNSLSPYTENDYKEAINKRDKFFRYCIEKYVQEKGVRVKFESWSSFKDHITARFIPGLKI